MIEFSYDRSIDPKQLIHLFRQTGWARGRTLEGVRQMLSATPVVLGAWEGDQLVGFARTITDGIYRALIDDVIVDESYRGRGIGSELVRRLTQRLEGVEEVFLRCGEGVVSFYEKHCFQQSRSIVLDLVRLDDTETG